MSEMGDFYRERREYRSELRRHWNECPDCKVAFGNGTLVAPGCHCRNCNWLSPGEMYSDARAAIEAIKIKRLNEAKALAAKAERKKALQCKICGKHLKNRAGVANHMKDAHGANVDNGDTNTNGQHGR